MSSVSDYWLVLVFSISNWTRFATDHKIRNLYMYSISIQYLKQTEDNDIRLRHVYAKTVKSLLILFLIFTHELKFQKIGSKQLNCSSNNSSIQARVTNSLLLKKKLNTNHSNQLLLKNNINARHSNTLFTAPVRFLAMFCWVLYKKSRFLCLILLSLLSCLCFFPFSPHHVTMSELVTVT